MSRADTGPCILFIVSFQCGWSKGTELQDRMNRMKNQMNRMNRICA